MWLKHYALNEHEQKLASMCSVEFDKYMMSNYADMFKNRNRQEDQKVIAPMNFGFEIGSGWHHVLDSLCKKLKIIQDLTGYVCIFDQIKEKFGGARFYYHIELMDENKRFTPEQGKEIEGIIENLVSQYEEYCDYVCEELGTNVDAGEKVRVGSWYYGMGIKGFKQWVKRVFPDTCGSRIESAEKDLACKHKIKEIKDQLSDLSVIDLCKVDELVSKLTEEKNEKR